MSAGERHEPSAQASSGTSVALTGAEEQPARASWWLVLIGLPIGFASSLAGIGGGLFAGSLLHFRWHLDLRRATGTALVLVFATTTSATLTEALQPDSSLDLRLIGALVVGVAFGAGAGFAFSERVSERLLRALFAVVLLAASLRILLAGGGDALARDPELRLTLVDYLWAAAVGGAGGFVAPVLGVGGGLIMVPGLFLGLPGLGFDAARAMSLATGSIGSLRSLVLKHRAGRVCWRHGLRLAAGALLGAATGVTALGIDQRWIEVGRVLLGVVLALVGLRFARDWMRDVTKV